MTSQAPSAILDAIERFNARAGTVASIEAAFTDAEAAEAKRLATVLARDSDWPSLSPVTSPVSVIGGSSAGARVTAIPPLPLRPKADSDTLACNLALNRAARAIEVQQLMRCVVQWEHVCEPLWAALAAEASAEAEQRPLATILNCRPEDVAGQLSYAGFMRVADSIDPLRQGALERLMPENRLHYAIFAARAEAAAARQQQQDPDFEDEGGGGGSGSGSGLAEEEAAAQRAAALLSGAYCTVAPADSRCDATEAELLRFYASILPRVDAALFLACPRNAKTGTVDISTVYETLQVRIAAAKFAGEMMLMDATGQRSVSREQLEAYAEDTVPGVPGYAQLVRRQLVEAYKTMLAERFFWQLDTKNTGRVDLRALIALPDVRDMLLHQLKAQELSAPPASEPVRWFACATTARLVDEFNRLDQRRKRLLSAGDMRRVRKVLGAEAASGNATCNGPLPVDVSPISFTFIKRYSEVTPTFSGELDFGCFVQFVLAVELLPQRCPRPGVFFDAFDADGCGSLTPTRMSRFMGETRQKLAKEFDGLGATAERQVEDLFHLIRTATPYVITRAEFLASPNVGLFCALAIDALALIAYEQRDWTNPKIKQEELMQRPFSGRR
jgi:hypothetical protein